MCELLTGCLSFLHCLKLLEDSPLNKIEKVLEDQDGFYGISCTLVLRLPICQTAIALALPDQKLTIARPKRVLRQTARLLVRDFNKGEFYIKRLDPSQGWKATILYWILFSGLCILTPSSVTAASRLAYHESGHGGFKLPDIFRHELKAQWYNNPADVKSPTLLGQNGPLWV
ncbi:hypothetical protein VNO77_20843 [Canavalia gladiata]|uniref:Uncharacterized protein n=1 Tax=Canavalia gladiata TaxID=3824 RepID=A0AAN9LTI3_CANGL